MKTTKVLVSLMLAVALAFGMTAAFAATIEPEDSELEHLAGATVHATVGAYDKETKTFTVTVYEEDQFDDDDVARLAAGDTLLAGGYLHKITGTKDVDGTLMFLSEDGDEIYFDKAEHDDDLIARVTMDDRIFMNVRTVLHLPAAEGIVLEDDSNPDLDAKPVISTGLEEVLKVQAEKEQNSNGLNYYATTITLNRDLEIEKIHVSFDVAQ